MKSLWLTESKDQQLPSLRSSKVMVYPKERGHTIAHQQVNKWSFSVISCTVTWISFPSCVLPKAKTADEFLLIPAKILQIISDNLRLCSTADYTVHKKSYMIQPVASAEYEAVLPFVCPCFTSSPLPSTNNLLGFVVL